MLVLGRKKDEEIVVDAFDANGSPIVVRIVVIQVQGSTVRLGLDAPKDIRIMRTELLNKTE